MTPTFNPGRISRYRLTRDVQEGLLRIRHGSDFCPRWRYDEPLSRWEKKLYRRWTKTLSCRPVEEVARMVPHVPKWQKPLLAGLVRLWGGK